MSKSHDNPSRAESIRASQIAEYLLKTRGRMTTKEITKMIGKKHAVVSAAIACAVHNGELLKIAIGNYTSYYHSSHHGFFKETVNNEILDLQLTNDTKKKQLTIKYNAKISAERKLKRKPKKKPKTIKKELSVVERVPKTLTIANINLIGKR